MTNIEKNIYDTLIQMAEKKQRFYITNKFLIDELIKHGFSAPYNEIQLAADRLYCSLAAHPAIESDPIESCLMLRS
jgi:hypothetical protein